MCCPYLYLESHGRMPISTGIPLFLEDPEDFPPPCRCLQCRQEVYDPNENLCRRCKGELNYET